MGYIKTMETAMTNIERLTIRILPQLVIGGSALLFACVLALACSGCGTPAATESDTDQLTAECDAMIEVAFTCTTPGYEPRSADHEKCHDTAVANVAIPGCVDVSHEEIACFEAFFESYSMCSSATPASIRGDLGTYVHSHCPNVITNGSALHCPDFT